MNTYKLGDLAAEALGVEHGHRTWWVRQGKTITEPVLTSTNAITISEVDYSVTFYVWWSNTGYMVFDGILVKGWSDTWEHLSKVLQHWSSQTEHGSKIQEKWEEKLAWLKANPGFRRPLEKKVAQKKVYASQTDL